MKIVIMCAGKSQRFAIQKELKQLNKIRNAYI